jgi:hypothetical protein
MFYTYVLRCGGGNLYIQIAALTAANKAQAPQIRKVSGQLRAQAPVPRVVAND